MTRFPRAFVAVCAALAWMAGAAGAQGVAVDRSEIRFVVKQLGVAVEGRFRRWNANVVFLPDVPAKSRAEFDVDLASIDLASEESEAEARGPQWFDIGRFPVAHFASQSIRDAGGDRYEVAGRLTIKGVSRDVLVPVTVRRDASGVRTAEGTFVVRRLDFRLGEGAWADLDTVADDVTVRFRMVLSSA